MKTSIARAVDYRVDPFDLRLMVAIIEHGSITAAAGVVHLSVAATSERLKALEHAVGTKLFERSKAGAAATAAGTALARHAQRVLVEIESLQHEMARFGGGLRGTLRVACNTVAMAEFLPSCLGPFLLDQPDLDLDVREMASDGVVEALHGGLADLGIVSDYADTSGFTTRPWHEDQLVAVLPRSWRLDRRRSVHFRDLLDHPFVGLSRDSGLSRLLATEARRSGRLPHHRVRLSGFEAVGRLVVAGVGLAIMPRRAANRLDRARVRCLTLADAWAKRRLVICTTEQSEAVPGVKALAAALGGA